MRTFMMIAVMGLVVALPACKSASPTGSETPMASSEPTAEQIASGVWSREPVGGFTLTFDEVMSRLQGGREAWEVLPELNLAPHPGEKYLQGVVIVLDPGHGGKGLEVPAWKAGPTGQREAVMNLRVALMLRAMLEQAGAVVGMTRETEFNAIADDRIGDYDHNADPASAGKNTLTLRAEVANNFPRPDGGIGADLFISLHHNASLSPTTNWPSVWFHGPADSAEPALDAARHIAFHLMTQMRHGEVGKTSPLMSDRQMYAGGFGVLRQATVPAILLESSFFSHPDEEQRLADPGYLAREAYAIYLGLVEWAYSGRPTQTPPEVVFDQRTGVLTVTTTLNDGLPPWWGHELGRVLRSTVTITVNGRDAGAVYDPSSKTATATVTLADAERVTEDGEPAAVDVTVHHANFLKQHNWPQRYTLPLPPEAEHATADPAGPPTAAP